MKKKMAKRNCPTLMIFLSEIGFFARGPQILETFVHYNVAHMKLKNSQTVESQKEV